MGTSPIDGTRARAVEELQFYWQSFEEAVGLRSAHAAMVDAMCGVSGVRGAAMGPAEEMACWSNRVGASAFATGRALRRMVAAYVVVLYRMYGPRDPSARHEELGELAPIAEYTRTVGRHRDVMVRREGDWRIAALHGDGEDRARAAQGIRVATERAISTRHALDELLAGDARTSDVETLMPHAWRMRAVHARRADAVLAITVEAEALLNAALDAYVRAREEG